MSSQNPLRDTDGKWSASRILAFSAYLVALAHIVHHTFFVPQKIDWGAIAAFLVAVAVPYLGNSVKNALRKP